MAIKLNIPQLTKYCNMTDGLHRINGRGAKVIDQTALATRMGVAQSTVHRLIESRINPGEKTIAALMRVFPDLEFDDLFTTVDIDAA